MKNNFYLTRVLINCIVLWSTEGLHPHVGLDEYQIMTRYSYPYEKHFVTTEDGYILELTRILPRRDDNSSIPYRVYPKLMSATPGEPVLLMHGITCNGRVFVAHDPEKALAFILANHGYDVFVGNARGNSRSRRHRSLDPDADAREFWDFSLDDIGIYDQTAMIDYIIALTGFPRVTFIGHSQGGTTFFIMAAGRPGFNEKIKIAFSLGGPGIMRDTPRPWLRRLAHMEEDLHALARRLEIYEMFQLAPIFKDVTKIMLDDQFGLKRVTTGILNGVGIVTGYNMDIDFIPNLVTAIPSGSSVIQFMHYLQNIGSGDFRMYDYHDPQKNYQKYRAVIPPRYNLSEITCKTVLYYSKSDFFINDKDAILMSNQMPNAEAIEIKVKKFSHADFLWAREIIDILFKDILWRIQNA